MRRAAVEEIAVARVQKLRLLAHGDKDLAGDQYQFGGSIGLRF